MGFKSYQCYTDESGTGKPHRYMVLGGVIMSVGFANHLDTVINEFREKRGFRDGYEFKWKMVEDTNINRYMDFVDYLGTQTQYFHFKSIVIDRNKLNHKKFNSGNQTVGYFKFHYQLMVNCFGKYFNNEDKCFLFIDKAKVNYDLDNYKNMLNNGLRKKYAPIYTDIFRTVEWKDSKKSNFIQIADVLTGGLRLMLNLDYIDGKPEPITKEKRELANHILTTWNIADPFKNTPRSKQDFSIWHFMMQK